jgi:hypothetical protein
MRPPLLLGLWGLLEGLLGLLEGLLGLLEGLLGGCVIQANGLTDDLHLLL